MTVFLHIGTEKTGTTTIQSFLSSNRSLLEEKGFYYPCTPGDVSHRKLAIYCQKINIIDDLKKSHDLQDKSDIVAFRRRFREKLSEEVKKHPGKNLVFSSEHCSSRLIYDDEIFRMKKLLQNLDPEVKIILYLRRQDQYLISLYSTAVRCGATHSFQFPERIKPNSPCDYLMLLDRWEKAFGFDNIIVRIFEKSKLIGGDLISDFVSQIGLKNLTDFFYPVKKNEGLDARCIEYLKLFNRYIPRFNGNKLNPERGPIFKYISEISGALNYKRFQVDLKSSKEFQMKFNDMNNAILEKYFSNEHKNQLFSQLPSSASDGSPLSTPLLDAKASVEISAKLWALNRKKILAQQTEIRRLKRKIAETKQSH